MKHATLITAYDIEGESNAEWKNVNGFPWIFF